jgi:hypothetical protein
MNRASMFSVVMSAALASGGGGTVHDGSVCTGVPASKPLGHAAFEAVLDTVAAGWNSNRAELAASCFTEKAVYL